MRAFLISSYYSAQNLGSSSGQQKVMSTEAVVSGTVADREENDEEGCLCLL